MRKHTYKLATGHSPAASVVELTDGMQIEFTPAVIVSELLS